MHLGQEDLRDRVDLLLPVQPRRVEVILQLVDDVRVLRLAELGPVVVDPEGSQDLLGLVDEVDDEGRVLAARDAVQPREGLHRLDARDALVEVHRAELRLVEAGLELVGDDHYAVVVGVERRAKVPRRRVHVPLGELLVGESGVVLRDRIGVTRDAARERHQRREIGEAVLGDVRVDRALEHDRLRPARRDDHRLGLLVQEPRDVVAEVRDDELDLLPDVGRVQRRPARQRPPGALLVDPLVLLDCLGELPRGAVRHVALQHVEDEPLLDRLAHAVAVETPRRAALVLAPEQRQRLVLGRRREGEVGDVVREAARFLELRHDLGRRERRERVVIDRQCRPELRGRLPRLRRVRLVDDDGEVPV